MRQKVVWFILGVLVGSLFVVSAYPTENNVQYVAPAVQKIPGKDYTTLLLYTPDGLPLNVKEVQKAVQGFVLKSAPNAKWYVYAVPELPEDAVITGYGIKVTKDGRVNVLVLATRKGVPAKPLEIKDKLVKWGREKPQFKEDIPVGGKIGVPEGWKVKTVDSAGNVKVYSGESEPYWHNFGKQELRYDDPPYGKLYAEFYMWGLRNDNDPRTETFACTKDSAGHGIYRVTPGILLKRHGVSGYGDYRIRKVKITHNWGVDPALKGELDDMGPVGVIDRYQTVPINVGPVSYPLAVGGYKVYGDAIDPPAIWTIDTLGSGGVYTETSEHTVGIMVASSGDVLESVLHDGNWHAVINVKLWAEFSGDEHLIPTDIHHEWTAMTWYVKVG
ncbi:MAG: hypothetical protein J7L37_07305 [Thermococcus sp.]|nr:hypothetical protein [Thermococcus sp.]